MRLEQQALKEKLVLKVQQVQQAQQALQALMVVMELQRQLLLERFQLEQQDQVRR